MLEDLGWHRMNRGLRLYENDSDEGRQGCGETGPSFSLQECKAMQLL